MAEQREAAQMRSIIVSLKLTVSMLESSIVADLELAAARDLPHYAYCIGKNHHGTAR